MSYTEFRPDEFSTRIRLERYGASPTESWEEHSRRIAHHVALYSEKSELVEKTEELYYDEIVSNRFCPGGRIQYGSQRPKGQLLNCFRAGTPVHTTEGIFPIESLIGKSSVTILDRDGTERQATFRAFGRQQLLRVTFANGDVVYATPNHNWFTSSRHPRGLVTTKTHSLEGRRVPLVCKLRPITNKEEWLTGVQHGLTFGDGSLYMGGKYSALRQFGDSKHLVEDYFPSWSTYEQIDCLQVGKLPPEWKTIPNVDDVSVSYLIGFLAGVIASDGHVDKRGHVMFHNRDFETTRAVQKISAYVGIPCYSIKLTRTINPFNNEPSTLYKLAFAKRGFYVEEKPNHELILKNLHREHLANCCPPSTKTISVKVLEVKDTEIEEEVYCAIEPETHSFTIASGIATGNCFVLGNSFLDSREGWGKITSDSIIVTGTGGGIGINFSPVRPRGAEIRGHSGKATGAVSLMEIINAVANVIKAGGGRRAALMFALNHDHPDTLEFMNKKLDLSQLNNANVSTVFMNESPGDFLTKVKRDELHQFVWQGNVVGEIPARELWNIILKNAVNCGEPGILNGWLANKENNIHYHADLISTNPCGEIWLEKYGCCDLGALVLPRFVKDGEIDKKLLARSVYAAVRFLDGVLDANNYPLKEIEENCKNVRRIGLGVMGLHDALILCGKKYSSDEGVEWVDKLMSFIKNKAYEASIELAIEKGQFPALDRQKFVESGFCKRSLKTSIKEKILLHGIRNCALLTIAPTGTTAIESMVTSGIEPIYSFAYRRRFRSGNGDEFDTQVVEHPLFAALKHDPTRAPLFENALELSVESHMRMQAICQKHIDNAVSKTINVPSNYEGKDLDETLRAYIDQLKGVTVYKDGSRGESPIQPLTFEEAMQLQSCPSGVCDLG